MTDEALSHVVHAFQFLGGLENAPIVVWGGAEEDSEEGEVQVSARPLSAARRPWVGLKGMVRTFQRAEDLENAPIEVWARRGRRRGRGSPTMTSAARGLWVGHKH